MDNNKTAVKAKGLSKAYGQLQAVNDISFTVDKGEIFGLLGPNGAGKTTSIRIITGIFPPDVGEIEIEGYSMLRNPLEAKMKMGVVPEFANAYMDLTAIENILFMGEMYGIRGRDVREHAEYLLTLFGLKERRDDKVGQFSKGMAQRVVLCMALINKPQILFLDEPTGGLDVQSSRLIRNIIRELNKTATTVFLTTHNINEANELCDRIAIMNRGKIAAVDSPENLKNTFQGLQSVEVSFHGDELPSLGDLPGVKTIEKRRDKHRLYTEEPGKLVENLIKAISNKEISLKSIQTLGPELEDVFVELTGGELNNEV